MGSLENGVPVKRDPLLRSSSNKGSAFQRPIVRFSRFLFFRKLDYLQWVCTVAVFCFFVVLFQMFLPGLIMEKSGESLKNMENGYGDLSFIKNIGGLDFGEGIRFEPSKLLQKFQKEADEVNLSSASRLRHRFGYRKPQLALVFPDLLVDPQQLLMVTVASALLEMGYTIQVYSLEDGPVNAIWRNVGFPVTIIRSNAKSAAVVDWLNYDGIIVNSLEARGVVSCFVQEPFKSLPLIWTIPEGTLATRLRQYNLTGKIELVNDWKKVFNRATAVVFPNYVLPMIYSTFDSGNYFVIPGSPAQAWEVDNFMASHRDSPRVKMGYGPDDFVIALVRSQFLYKGLWLEHALILQALLPLVAEFPVDNNSNSHLKILITSGNSANNYSVAVEAIALNLRYPKGVVKYIAIDVGEADNVLAAADIVIYGSFLEEQSFPDILIKAMSFGKLIIAPDLSIIKKYLKDRTDQPRGSWEDVYRSAKRADRAKNDLHERDDGELERTGQPLCIYEPYFGEGTWPFLHATSLYRGIGLSTKGRRREADDIDAPSRLPLLNNPYYRDALGEYGAFFAIANRVDRIHRNAWIGFQSWRATARNASLSKIAETALLNAIQARKHGDTLYFWVRMDMDPRNPSQLDFWSFCDAINAGNCKFAFSEALKKMYGIKRDWDSLPPMPVDGDTWSVMQSWALPTRSFLEFVMFSRMFVDALDAQIYNDHHQRGHCYLSLSKDKHCYSRVLELLINVWAYHGAKRMVYVNPKTGEMHEHHKLKNRRGHMWVKWFSYATLKSMDEDLAEESDDDHPMRRWLWPSTGEVFWQGIYLRERNQRLQQKEKRRQQSKDKLSRMRRRSHQKVIGKYVKPPPEDVENSNSTTV
ncbi:uncharacterized protein LOC117932307 isoform X3 [Vitis riparia]|uniref:uncharacterized protein LOC117932307 isoform X3 n=1 Tax=Vitis riparia TaxID=96939 RepID=UPI00155A59C0|nr:uncharacterized protein LOC117932307 isoform X3 [Vitis riparia]